MNYTATTRADGLVSLPGVASNGIRYFVFVRNTTNGAYNATFINGSRYEYSPWIKVTDGNGSAVANTQIDFVLYYILQ